MLHLHVFCLNNSSSILVRCEFTPLTNPSGILFPLLPSTSGVEGGGGDENGGGGGGALNSNLNSAALI